MDLHELRVAARLIDGLAKRALFAEKQMVALEGQCAEWQRIADTLKEERNALRSARQDKAALLDAFGSLTDERDTLRKERDALRADVADLRTLCDQWKQRETELLAEIDRLKKPARNHPVAVGEWVRRTDAECDGIYFGRGVIAQVIDIHDAPEKQYTVSRPEWNGYCVPWAMQYCEPCDPPEATHDTPEGKAVAESASEDIRVGDMVEVFQKTSSDTLFDDVSIHGTVSEVFWAETGNKCVRLDSSTMNRRSRGGSYFAYCDVRKIAKETAEAAAEPKPGDVVRLVRVPTPNEYPHDSGRWEPNWGGSGDYMRVHYVGSNINGTRVVRAVFGLEWPLSCVEVVKGGGK